MPLSKREMLAWAVPGFRFSRLDKSPPSAIMKTKGDTVTCSQASKSYYKIADHSSAIEWSACFCGEKEQQNCYQQENPQCFLPHLHHLPSHEMRWDFGGLTTEVTVSRMGHYIILRRTLSTLSKPPRRVSYTLAGWPLFTPMRDITIYYNNSYSAMLAPGAHLSTASRSPSPFQGRHRFSATYVVTVNANGSPERGAVSVS